MAFNYGNYPAFNPGYNPQPYNNQPTPPMPVPPPQPTPQFGQGISPASRVVSNREEAMGVPADFSSAMMLFPDVTNNKIYLKRWNMGTGAADFAEFVPVMPETVEQGQAAPAFATTEQVDELKDLLGDIKKDIEQLKKPVANKGVKKNDADE